MINSWQTITSSSSVREAWTSSRPISISFEFRSKTSLITIICMDPHSPNKLIAKKYCFLILLDEQRPVSFSWSDFSFFCYFIVFLLLIFTKIMLLLFYLIFFSWKLFLFFHVPGCSGMFRNVPCSGVLSTPTLWSSRPSFPTFSLMFIAPLNFKFPT